MPALIGIALWALIPGFIAKNKGRSFWGYYFLSFLITPLITMIITLCLSKATNGNFTDQDEPKYVDTVSETNSIGYCRKCGEKLVDDSKFCRKCGTEVIEIDNVVDPVTANLAFCKKCGADISNDTDICHVCGEKKVMTDNENQ